MEFPMIALATLACASNSEVYFCRMLITWQPYFLIRSKIDDDFLASGTSRKAVISSITICFLMERGIDIR